MIVVRVELHSARTGRVSELARMEICNQGSGTRALRNYRARVLTGRSTAALDRRQVQAWPSERVHVWNLVAALLALAGYGRHAAPQCRSPVPIGPKQCRSDDASLPLVGGAPAGTRENCVCGAADTQGGIANRHFGTDRH